MTTLVPKIGFGSSLVKNRDDGGRLVSIVVDLVSSNEMSILTMMVISCYTNKTAKEGHKVALAALADWFWMICEKSQPTPIRGLLLFHNSPQ